MIPAFAAPTWAIRSVGMNSIEVVGGEAGVVLSRNRKRFRDVGAEKGFMEFLKRVSVVYLLVVML